MTSSVGRHSHPVIWGKLKREIRPFQYRRGFELDPGINAAGIQAKLEQGVVKLVLPKAKDVQPRKIEATV